MRFNPTIAVFAAFGVSMLVGGAALAQEKIEISSKRSRLGLAGAPEWDIFQNDPPTGTNLVLKFAGKANSTESTLLIRQDDVKQDWPVILNGKKLGSLFLMEGDVLHTLRVPPGAVRDGENELTISGKTADDIIITSIELVSEPVEKLLGSTLGGVLRLETIGEDNAPLPSRITIVDANGTMTALRGLSPTNLAVRPGVVYSPGGEVAIGLLPGEYTVHVTRGPEFSLYTNHVSIRAGAEKKIQARLKREVDTTGWVSSDTHIHTLPFSRHGDATIEERLLTLAGENIEMPVSTEHNQHANYFEPARRTGMDRFFTIVPGNEVTTSKGHFNMFPVELEAKAPDWKLPDWPELISAMRATPKVQAVILNHPTDTHSGFTPFARTNFNLATGENLRGFDFTFDAMEVINSGAMRSDWMQPFRAWFALLNSGKRVTAVGASDSHDVSRFIVGQGRTYIMGNDEDPAKLNTAEFIENFKKGRVVVSLGLFVTMKLNRRIGIGDRAATALDRIPLDVQVQSPGWIRADRLELYANGELVQRSEINNFNGRWNGTGILEKPKHDTWYVAIASGPGITNAFWALARPYQPSSPHFDARVIGATNPIWFDADADGKFTSAREYARQLVEKTGNDMPALIRELSNFDRAVAAQAASLLQSAGKLEEARKLLSAAPAPLKNGFEDYQSTFRE